MNTKQLRQKILDLAIRGKLVPQNPNDEPASVLLERIRLKKKEKNTTTITNNMKPFDVPESWIWCKLGEIAIKIGSGSTPRGGQSVYQNHGIKFIRSQNVYNDGLLLDDVVYISEEINMQMSNTVVQASDILLNITGASIGRCAIVPKNFDCGNVNQHVSIIRLIDKNLQAFIHKVIISSHIQELIGNIQVGAAQAGLPAEKQRELLIPLPPLAEQHRIVVAIESAFAVIDEIERNKTDLQAVVAIAKQKILSLAIQGKLVPQDPNDEPAAVLLERLGAEKKNGSFDLPNSWSWCKFGDVCDIARGGSPRPIQDFITNDENGVNWIKIGDTEQGGKYITKAAEKIKPEGISRSRYVYAGNFLLTNSMSFGRPYILKIDGCIHDGWLVIGKVENVFIQDYLYYLLSSSWAYQSLSMVAYGSTVKNLKSDTVKAVLLPLPPLAEQKRLVAAIEAAFEQLEKITEMIK